MASDDTMTVAPSRLLSMSQLTSPSNSPEQEVHQTDMDLDEWKGRNEPCDFHLNSQAIDFIFNTLHYIYDIMTPVTCDV